MPNNFLSFAWPWRIFLGLLLLVSGTAAVAGEKANTFTLRQLIELAQRDNKDLQAARYAIEIGRARLIQAGLRPNSDFGWYPKPDISCLQTWWLPARGRPSTFWRVSRGQAPPPDLTRVA